MEEKKDLGGLKEWNTDMSNDAEFLQATEATTASDSNWASYTNLQGSARKILWDAPMDDPSSPSTSKLLINGSGINISGDVTIS